MWTRDLSHVASAALGAYAFSEIAARVVGDAVAPDTARLLTLVALAVVAATFALVARADARRARADSAEAERRARVHGRSAGCHLAVPSNQVPVIGVLVARLRVREHEVAVELQSLLYGPFQLADGDVVAVKAHSVKRGGGLQLEEDDAAHVEVFKRVPGTGGSCSPAPPRTRGGIFHMLAFCWYPWFLWGTEHVHAFP